jgi:hypothetical protein
VDVRRLAAIVYACISAVVSAFQIALALGAPWGAYAMSGAFPGQLPPALRMSAVIQAVVLLLLGGVVLARAGVALRGWSGMSRWLAWVAVGFAAVSLVLNLMSLSAGERLLWAPVASVLLLTGLVVATGPLPGNR